MVQFISLSYELFLAASFLTVQYELFLVVSSIIVYSRSYRSSVTVQYVRSRVVSCIAGQLPVSGSTVQYELFLAMLFVIV